MTFELMIRSRPGEDNGAGASLSDVTLTVKALSEELT